MLLSSYSRDAGPEKPNAAAGTLAWRQNCVLIEHRCFYIVTRANQFFTKHYSTIDIDSGIAAHKQRSKYFVTNSKSNAQLLGPF